MNKKSHEISVFDCEDNSENIKEVMQPQNFLNPQEGQIFIFDDEQDIVDDCQQIEKIENSVQRQDMVQKESSQEQYMSQRQFKEKCTKLEDRIIFSNLKNFKNDIARPQTTFFQDAKVKRRESQNQMRRNSKIPHQQRLSMFAQIPKDIKVDFINQSVRSTKKQTTFKTQSQMQSSINDQLVPKKEQNNTIQQKYDIQGAYIQNGKKELKIEEIKQKNVLKVSNFRQFIYTQLKPNYQLFILIKRTQSGFINSTYKFYLQDNKKFIMSCQKQGLSTYVFSSSEIHISQDHISYLGKLQSNFFGSEFVCYDGGQDCSKTKMMENYKKQLGHFMYSQQKNKPRKFQTYITTCDNKLTDFTIIDKKVDNIIKQKWQKQRKDNIMKLYSKQPSYDLHDNNYKLDFKGLGGVPSTKNFIVQNQDYPDALIFGRQDKQTYLLSIKAPFSLIQAVAVCMSSIHYKFL